MARVSRNKGVGAAGEGYFQEGRVVGIRKAEVRWVRGDLLAAGDERGDQPLDHRRSNRGPELRTAQDSSVLGENAPVVEKR